MPPIAKPEKRKHKRFPLADDTVAISDAGIGNVLDISEGGFAVKYLKPKDLSDECDAVVFSAEKDFLVSELPIKVVRKDEIEVSPQGDATTQTVGVTFNNPSPGQHEQIKKFVADLSES
ncbi:MAG: PilZ domain-containing protein [Proteobacteria bacterium]|nr:PilZ domain-containing protein [Desulfobulbaceae bacterium]MBU4151557.1 PilZ domain-containing protein [Pseudomonadota bacterium]